MMRRIAFNSCGLAATLACCGSGPAGIDYLQVISVEPAARSISAPVGSEIVVRFDRPVDRTTVTSQSFWAFGRWSGTAGGSIRFLEGDTAVGLDSDHDFSAGEQVMVVLSHDLRGADGAPLRSGGYSYQFWTRSRPSSRQFEVVDTLSTNLDTRESSRPYGGVGSDIDGDGWLDITVVNEDTADLRVFLNSGDGLGTFGPILEPTPPVNTQASPSEPCDFNQDGAVDLCVANIATGTLSILLGNGDGTFGPQQEITVGNQPRGIAVLDADGDGDIDIANTNFGGNDLSLLLNDGSGTFGPPAYFEGGGDGERALASGDMNGDGLLDLVVSAYTSQQVIVVLNNGNGTFTPVSTQAAGGSMWMLVLGDVDGDGNEDVAGVNVSPVSYGAILRGSGAGQLLPADLYATDLFPLATDLGDLDGDGDLDWITSSYSGDWYVFQNNGAGGFSFADELPAVSNASCSVPFDADNDGDLDLALIDEIDDSIQIAINSRHAAAGDVTGDGNVDVVDLLALLAGWGPCPFCPADLNGDDVVDVIDLLALLSNWT